TKLVFFNVKRGAINIKNHLRASRSLHSHRTRGIPDVFADVDPYIDTIDQEEGSLVPGTEVAILIEDAIVRQVVFMICTNKLTLVNNRGSVINIMYTINKTNHRSQAGQVAAGQDQVVQGCLIDSNKTRLEQQIFRGIAR